MRDAGFDGFERGEYGSTAEHLDVLDYKIQQDKKRAKVLDVEISDKTNILLEQGNQLSAYDDKIKKKQEQTAELAKKLKLTQEADRTISEISEMGKKTLFGKIEATPDEWKTVTNLAKEAVTGRATIRTLRDKLKRSDGELNQANERLKSQTHGISETMEYFQAKARSPKRLREVVADIMAKPPEIQPSRGEIRKNRDEHSF